MSLGRGWPSVKVVGAWLSVLITAGGGPGVGGSAGRLVILAMVEKVRKRVRASVGRTRMVRRFELRRRARVGDWLWRRIVK